ncbi:hypothetical protein HY570_02920 [Candidatus Micrarchaeota archaeon]|nr:hypothetical protein [Candidatus Micrarchaeota archaeon]
MAVREGGIGATILVYQNNKYIIPKEPKGGVSIPRDLQKKFKPNFTIILTYGANKHILERAAWSIASKILNL